MKERFSGGCACGKVRYECSEPPIVQLICHCRDCQRASGSAYAAVAIVARDRVKFSGVEPKYHAVKACSGRTMQRGFCSECGSPVSIRRPETPLVEFIQAASLDVPSAFAPSCEVWVSSADSWHHLHPDTQKFETDSFSGGGQGAGTGVFREKDANMSGRRYQDVWIEQCAAAERIKEDHGVKDAFNYIVGEKLMTYAQTAASRPEFARDLPRFVAEVRRLFSAAEIREHLARIEREDREAAEAASGQEIDDFDEVARPEDVAAQIERFAAMKELLTVEQLGTS